MVAFKHILGHSGRASQVGMRPQIARHAAFHELDVASLSHVTGGYVGPDQSITDFPVWVLPYINIAHVGRIAQVVGAVGR
jgi:hypothetical protein